MRGAHRGVWCSKSTHLIEAELFAAPNKRPAPSGRALLCAASYARKIQGNKASKNLPDARNRALVTPVSLHISDVSAQRKVRGVKRGQETIPGVLSPFVPAGEHRLSPRRGYGVFSAARRRLSLPPKAAIPPPWARRLRRRRRPLCTLTLSVQSPPAAHRCIGGRCTVCRRYKGKDLR